MVEEIPYESLPLLPIGELLGEQVRVVIITLDVACPPLITGNPFPDQVVSYALALLFQGRVGDGSVT